MTYEEFFTSSDIATYKRVKRGTMLLGRLAREIATGIVYGRMEKKGKEFVYTNKGVYRLCMSGKSDNTTERAAHERMGAITVCMGDEKEMTDWFALHGVAASPGLVYATYKEAIRIALERCA